MKARDFAAIATLALSLGACGHKEATDANAAQTDATATEGAAMATGAPSPAALTGQDFANHAAASDAFEIASSKLAATNAQSPAVKSFAEEMIKAHTESTAKLKKAGAAASPAITPDPTLSSDQQQQLDALKGKTGADFDAAFATAQVSGHQQALDLLKRYSAQGDVPQLKSFADEVIPIVTRHLDMAKKLPSGG